MELRRKHPERTLRDAWLKWLVARGWFAMTTHGSIYQSGLPDVYATHIKFGPRWIEIKLPDMKGSQFTARQKEVFPQLVAHGTPVWILTAVCESEYRKLFEIPAGNLLEYQLIQGW